MSKAERLNQELIFLRNKRMFHLSDLMTEFKISKRTALRDLEELFNIGLPYYTEKGRNGNYRVLDHKLLTPVLFSNQEIEAISFAIKSLSLVSSTPFDQSYPQIKEKLLASLPKAQQKEIDSILKYVHYVQRPPLKEHQPLATLLKCISNEQIMTLVYTQHKIERIDIQLAEIFYRDGIWFGAGWDFTHQHWGIFRCDHMQEVVVAAEEIQQNSKTLAGLKELELLHDSSYHNINALCKLTEKGQERFRRHHYPFMKLEGDYLMTGYNLEERDYLVDYLMSFAGEIEIISPDDLRSAYLKKLQQMLQQNSLQYK